ncbi:hypothetical protein JM47_00795 [Ureaplasma diversum]|uniref:Uncharacterized protein n=2 Tax=Ureaplasma diversum TaxID=42094 RepID=A0A084F1L1_9BACT|nr:hypothetical protein [Ureaplasma diversum]AJQ45182.1 hypothetical protein JM47_00795 [Ureaplasma diversum]KEZ24103.1 hypothetical protein UDIV_0720 [Ureaplasma diversum NCTC 246]
MKKLIVINNSKQGSIKISCDDLQQYIKQNLSVFLNGSWELNQLQVSLADDNELDINVMIKPKQNQLIDLAEIRNIQNHLSAFIHSNLGIYTKRISLGADL